jgi:hypothetical protein
MEIFTASTEQSAPVSWDVILLVIVIIKHRKIIECQVHFMVKRILKKDRTIKWIEIIVGE